MDQLLVTVWNKPGYLLVERMTKLSSDEEQNYPDKKKRDCICLISAENTVQKDWFCTDLVPLAPGVLDQFYVARSQSSLNLVDITAGKVYPLSVQPNPLQKFQKLAVIHHGGLKGTDFKRKKQDKDKDLDKVKISIIYTIE